MRKRLTALLLALALPALSACGAKTAEVPTFPVTETTPQQAAPSAQETAPSEEAAPVEEAAMPETAAPSEEAAPTEAPAAGETQPEPAGEAAEPEEEEEAPVGVDAYWAHLREQWLNEPEEGYVWTITIDGVMLYGYRCRRTASDGSFFWYGSYSGTVDGHYVDIFFTDGSEDNLLLEDQLGMARSVHIK